MPAKADVIYCWAKANNTPGTTFSNIATTHNFFQIDLPFGSSTFLALAKISNVIAPNAQRTKVTPNGDKNTSPNSIKINEQPQTRPRAK